MQTFEEFNLPKLLKRSIDELNFTSPTPIQSGSFNTILSGKDMLGIAQTGTGKTLAYMLPILSQLKYSNQIHPRVLIMVPTRELVVQVVEKIESYTKYMNVRTLGIFGGVNINTQRLRIAEGTDIIVGTPGRVFDLAVSNDLKLKEIKKLVIDEVDVMLDLGFRFQLTNILEQLPTKRQNILFSATMTEEVDAIIDDYFVAPEKISIAVSGTPLKNIQQEAYAVPNFYTKLNLLAYILGDKSNYNKVLVFVSSKKNADLIHKNLSAALEEDIAVIHSNKAQNTRLNAVESFDNGEFRILIATDIMARGLDLVEISHVINFDTPIFAENYMHRIGRTGRAEKEGHSILFYTEKEKVYKEAIEDLMAYEIPLLNIPKEVEISTKLTAEEKPVEADMATKNHKIKNIESGPAFHVKKKKNQKVNLGPSYLAKKEKKYKKPITKGDKGQNRRKKR